jgi:integrase
VQQLELPAIGEGRLRESISWLLQYECDGVRAITMAKDYQVRADWCLETFGDCKLEELCGRPGYERMRQIMKDELSREDGMKRVSLKKRFQFVVRVLKVAANRELIERGRIPDLPQMADDGVSKDAHHTYPHYLAFRSVLPSPRHRIYYDLGWWTGMRREDLESTMKEQVDPWRPFTDENGKQISMGCFFVRNHKREKFTPYWIPMEPEFRQCVKEFYDQTPMGSEDLITGKFSKPSRWMDPASIRAGVPRITPHSFRHSRLTYLESIGVHPEDARYAVGASSVKVLREHYLHPSPGTLRRLVPAPKPKPATDGDDRPPLGTA